MIKRLIYFKTCNWSYSADVVSYSYLDCIWKYETYRNPIYLYIYTNIARSFLKLVDTHFPIGNKLHKIFNRNTVKVSYSCMNNVKSIITSHNTRIIRKSQPQDISAENCNCRNKHTCPLQNKCMSKDIVYKATILTGNTQDTKHYIGMTSKSDTGIISNLLHTKNIRTRRNFRNTFGT